MKKFKEILRMGMEWAAGGVVAVVVMTLMFVVGHVGIGLAAKAIYKTDLSRDDVYEAFQSVVTDLGTIKDAVDDITGNVGGDTSSLATLANETSADLTTDSTALSSLCNETSADLTTDSTAITALINEMAADWPYLINAVDELRGDFNAENTAGVLGNSITNAPIATISNGVVTPATRSASVVTPATRTASVVTPTSVSNTTGTLGTTTP